MFPKLLAGAVGIGAGVGTSATQVGQVQTASARVVVERAATALGGIERIRVVKNITLHGGCPSAKDAARKASSACRENNRF